MFNHKKKKKKGWRAFLCLSGLDASSGLMKLDVTRHKEQIKANDLLS